MSDLVFEGQPNSKEYSDWLFRNRKKWAQATGMFDEFYKFLKKVEQAPSAESLDNIKWGIFQASCNLGATCLAQMAKGDFLQELKHEEKVREIQNQLPETVDSQTVDSQSDEYAAISKIGCHRP